MEFVTDFGFMIIQHPNIECWLPQIIDLAIIILTIIQQQVRVDFDL